MKTYHVDMDLINGRYTPFISPDLVIDDEILGFLQRPVANPEGVSTGLAGVYFPLEKKYAIIRIGHKTDQKGRDAYTSSAIIFDVDSNETIDKALLDEYAKIINNLSKPLSFHDSVKIVKIIKEILDQSQQVITAYFPERPDMDLQIILQLILRGLPMEWRNISFRVGRGFSDPPHDKARYILKIYTGKDELTIEP